MEFCRITFVPGESVLRIQLIVLQHDGIAGNLGYYGCGGYGEARLVAADNAFDRVLYGKLNSAVDYDVIRIYLKV